MSDGTGSFFDYFYSPLFGEDGKIKAVFFDYSGVLANDKYLVYDANKLAMEAYKGLGIYKGDIPSFEEWEAGATIGASGLEYYLSEGLGEEAFHIVDMYKIMYEVINSDRFPILNEGVEETLKELKRQGIAIGVVSAHPRQALDRELDYFGIRDYFEFVEGDVTDKSVTYREKTAELGLSPHNVVIIDDIPHNGVHGMSEGVGVVIKRGGYSNDDVIDEWEEDAKAKRYPHIVIKDFCEFVELKDKLEKDMMEYFSSNVELPLLYDSD